MTRVKICGITCAEDAREACAAGADALGFNFAEEAKARGRYIAPEEARRLAGELPPFVSAVAVMVNPAEAEVEAVLRFCDWVQLHGEETPEFCGRFPGRVLKAFRAHEGFDPREMLKYPAAAYLLDAYVPGARGGTGRTCDWELARAAVELGVPLILAGGLTPENVAEAVRRVQPFAVDVAGGVESTPGRKDVRRMRDFVRYAKTSLPTT